MEEGVTSIGSEAFYRCAALETVTLPYSVRSIGIAGFSCSNLALKTVTIMNPACAIYDSQFTICKFFNVQNEYDVYICGYTGSTAHTYAEKYEKNFTSIGTLGDVNGDTHTDSSDAAMILQHYAAYQADGMGTFDTARLASADYNTDGSVDSSDAAMILRYYAENQAK